VKAVHIMLLAVGIGILGQWAHGKSITAKGAAQVVFALVVIAALDTGKTEPLAKGFAGIYLTAVLLGKNSPLNAIQKIK
jgi:hypothetical protein